MFDDLFLSSVKRPSYIDVSDVKDRNFTNSLQENFNPVFKVERGASIYGERFASGERYSYAPIINVKVGNHEWLYNEAIDEYRVQTLSFDDLMYELFMHSPFYES